MNKRNINRLFFIIFLVIVSSVFLLWLYLKDRYVLFRVEADFEGEAVCREDEHIYTGINYDNYEADTVDRHYYVKNKTNGYELFEIRKILNTPVRLWSRTQFEINGKTIMVHTSLCDNSVNDNASWVIDEYISFYNDGDSLQADVTCANGTVKEITWRENDYLDVVIER